MQQEDILNVIKAHSALPVPYIRFLKKQEDIRDRFRGIGLIHLANRERFESLLKF